MDVLELLLMPTRRVPAARLVGTALSVHATRMFNPGTIISGFRISGVTVTMLGPRDENTATTDEWRTSTCVPATMVVAVGFGSEATYEVRLHHGAFHLAHAGASRTMIVAVGFGSEATYEV
jgi:hypothetical protein